MSSGVTPQVGDRMSTERFARDGYRISYPWCRRDAAVAIALYAIAAALNLVSVWAVSRSLVLMGEEMSVSIRDVVFSVEQRAQASIWSTNFGAPVYYWIASHLDPSYSLFSARRWKAVAMALLAPLLYLVLRRRLGCGRPAAAFGGLVVALLPGVAMFGWLATENGLETVVGSAGLYLATSRRGLWRTAPVLAGISVTTYTSGVAWATVILAVCAWRAWRSINRNRELLVVAAAAVVAAGVVLFPRLWWVVGPQRLVAGGGTVDGRVVDNLINLGEQLAVSGRSYYFFSDAPALGSAVLAAATALCVFIAGTRRAVGPWLAVAAVTVVLWLPAGNVPGVRRAVALAVVAAVVLGVALDVLARKQLHPALTGLLAVGAAAVVVPLAVGAAAWQQEYLRGEQVLVADFPIPPGPMPPTFAAWDAQLRGGQLTVQEMINRHDGLRTVAVIWMLADRTGAGTAGLPTPPEIVTATLQR